MANNNRHHLVFDFSDDDNDTPLHFCDPVEIVSTYQVESVLPALKKVQESIDAGFYAAGYVSYEAAPAFDASFSVHQEAGHIPLLWFGLFTEPCEAPIAYTEGDFQLSNWAPATSSQDYYANIQSVKDAIEQQATHQVNYTMRFHSAFQGDDYALYQRLSNAQPGYNAYLNLGRFRIVSASPELFFHWQGNQLTMRPMKGTAARGRWTQEDRDQAAWLAHSTKNRNENSIIVDLMQHELATVSQPNAVKVSRSFDVERYPTVWQMTSTITTETPSDMTIDKLFQALFPCGSITGSPKTRTMQLIAELEDAPREVYCGAVGFMKPNGESIFNVPIRTVMIDAEEGMAQYGAGGGITSDSIPEEEYDEAFMKTKVLTQHRPSFELLESLRLDNGRYWLLERHLQRLQASGEYFNFSNDITNIRERLEAHRQSHSTGQYKVRLLVGEKGHVTIESDPIEPLDGSKPIAIAKTPIPKDNPFLYHKTTHRHVYDRHRCADPTIYDVLLWNDNQELTEFINGNLVLEWDGTYYTPPVESGLLLGTYSEALIADSRVQEHTLTYNDLLACTRIWLVNSVRGWVSVYM